MIDYAVKLPIVTYNPSTADSVAQFTATMDRLKYAVPLTIIVDITPVLLYNLMCLLPLLHHMFSTTSTVKLLLIVPALLPHPVQGMAHQSTNVSTAISQTEEAPFWAVD